MTRYVAFASRLADVTQNGTLAKRLAAGLALLTLAAAPAVLLAGAVRNWASVIVALTGVVAATTAAWYIVSRRGTVRWLGLIALAGSGALLAWSILAADPRPPRVVLALVFATLSVCCARLALGGASQATTAAPLATARPVLIINPRSGGGKATRFGLVDECKARSIEPVVLGPGDDLKSLAEAAITDGADIIGMAGGDGSQALVAEVAASHGIPHVLIPAGTHNHFALDLGLDRDDVVGALDAFTDGIERRVDLAEVNGRVFVNNVSLGIYAKIVQSPRYREAKLKTAADLLPTLLGPRARSYDLRFTGPDGTEQAAAQLILVSNNGYQLDRIGGRGTRERLDEGVLGVVAARIGGPVQAQRFAALEAFGQARRFEGWLEWTTNRFEIQSGGPVAIGIDGEATTMSPPLVFTSRPGALLVRVPRKTRRSPAATAIHVTSRSAIAELVSLTIGRRE